MNEETKRRMLNRKGMIEEVWKTSITSFIGCSLSLGLYTW